MPIQAPRISLVIPCRNESTRLPGAIVALQDFLVTHPNIEEVIIVVEKGTDNTAELARAAQAANPKFRAICNDVARGKGFAVKTGMLAASGEFIFFMDCDLSVPLRTVDEFLPSLRRADVVIGSRRLRESVIVQAQPLARVVFGQVFNIGLRLLRATEFQDTQCGFKAFRREAAKEIFSRLTIDGFAFDVEALVLADKLGFRMMERPVEWTDRAGTKVRAVQDGTKAFFEAILAARRARRETEALR